ncbi:MAG: hypothetical protein NWE93_14655 [Candidatus Bathyarchaeota archaeon]|nr:hypothetical protein [Candidatus Bathyarchaeota archaeon]
MNKALALPLCICAIVLLATAAWLLSVNEQSLPPEPTPTPTPEPLPIPPVPEFTLKTANHAYDEPGYAGMPAMHYEWKTIEITITNPQIDSAYSSYWDTLFNTK